MFPSRAGSDPFRTFMFFSIDFNQSCVVSSVFDAKLFWSGEHDAALV